MDTRIAHSYVIGSDTGKLPVGLIAHKQNSGMFVSHCGILVGGLRARDVHPDKRISMQEPPPPLHLVSNHQHHAVRCYRGWYRCIQANSKPGKWQRRTQQTTFFFFWISQKTIRLAPKPFANLAVRSCPDTSSHTLRCNNWHGGIIRYPRRYQMIRI